MDTQIIIQPIFPLDMPAWTFRGGFCAYAISIKISCSSPSYHNVNDLASSGAGTVTEFNLSHTSVRSCHGSWQNSPHKDDFVFISITNIHQCLVTGTFNALKSTHSLNIGHRYCDLHFLKVLFSWATKPDVLFCKNERNTSTALQKTCLTKMPHTYITYHSMASRGWNNRITQTDKNIHIKQELNKKSSNLLLLSLRGDGEWLPNYWCTASLGLCYHICSVGRYVAS